MIKVYNQNRIPRRFLLAAGLLLTAIIAAYLFLFLEKETQAQGSTIFIQNDYRWFSNADNVQPGSALSSENTLATINSTSTIVRLRINITASSTIAATSSIQLNIQYATSTGGPWADVGATATSTWQFYNNSSPTDGSVIGSTLLASSDITETYEETNPTVLNPYAIPVGQEGEWDFPLDPKFASDGATYYFRLTKNGGVTIDGYNNYPSLTINTAGNSAPAISAISDSPDPIVADNNITFSANWSDANNDSIKINVCKTDSLTGTACTNGAWCSSSAFTSSSPASCSYLTSNSDVGTNNYFVFACDTNNACSSSLSGTFTVNQATPDLNQVHYRWRNDDGSETSASWAASEDQATTIQKNQIKRLRIEVVNQGTADSPAVQYRLEYATSTGGPWLAVPATASTEAWEMADSANLTDGANTTNVAGGLSDANTNFKAGQVKETSNQTSGIILTTAEFTEIEYSLKATSNAVTGQPYYFRLTAAGTALDNYSVYPSVQAGTNSDSNNYWAWNDMSGWWDFYSPDTFIVNNTGLEGYASSSIGEISFNCNSTPNGDVCSNSNYKVTNNNGSTLLSGCGWNDSIGWIYFWCGDVDCDGSSSEDASSTCAYSNFRVTIDANGVFNGYAWNDAVGWISFNCANDNSCNQSNYKLQTSWRPVPAYGYLTSPIIDTGVPGGATLLSIVWQGTQPAGTSVDFQVAGSNSPSGPWNFEGPGGSTTDYYGAECPLTGSANPATGPDKSICVDSNRLSNMRYFRYKVRLKSDYTHTTTPVINKIILNWVK